MPDPVTLAIVGTSLLSGLASNSKARKATRANRRANEIERERRGIQNSISRRKALAERRRLQAATRAQALAAGVGLSSAAESSINSIDSQTSSQISQQTQFESLDLARDDQIKAANKANQQASNIEQIGGAITGILGAF